MDWKDNLLVTPSQISQLLAKIRRVAVLGIRSERCRTKPAYYVPAALLEAGLEIVPVPVYEPAVTHILGRPVYRSLAAVPGEINLVDVFRRAEDLPAHLDDLLEKRPGAVWLQSGIRNDAVAEALARAGIQVVQDRCLMIEYGKVRRA